MIKNDPSEFQPQLESLHGIYRGVIEDNNDPEKRGRCKIRIFGVHTDNKNKDEFDGIPTDELPWSDPCLSLFEGSVSGFGNFTVPLQGSHVFLFFESGHILKPKYFASAPGVPSNPSDPSMGFNDPSGSYPASHRLNQPDFHKLAREETKDTIVDSKTQNLIKNIEKALSKGSWGEFSPAYNAKYPNNIVYATHSGIIIELDSTPGEQRIHVYHPSNSYIEIDKNGNVVVKNVGNKQEISMQEKNQYVGTDKNITINNNKSEFIKSNEYKQTDGNKEEEIGGNKTLTISGNYDISVGGNCTITVSGNASVTASQVDVTSSGNTNVTAGGSLSITSTGMSMNGGSGSSCEMSAGTISLNP